MLCFCAVDPPQYNGGAIVKFYNVMKKQKGIPYTVNPSGISCH